MKVSDILLNILLPIAVFFLVVILLYRVEHGAPETQIHSVWDALWFTIVTLTTVGYGDLVPVTVPGKILGGVLVVGSLGTLGYLVGKIGQTIYEYRERKKLGHHGTTFTDHIIVVGWDDFMKDVVQQLLFSERQVAILTRDRENVDLIYEEFGRDQVFVLVSEIDNYDAYKKAGIEHCFRVLLSHEDDTKNLVTLLNLQDQYGDIKIVVTVHNEQLRESFRSAGAEFVIPRDEIPTQLTASHIYEPDVAEYAVDLISSVQKEGDYEFQQYFVTEGHEFDGMNYGELFENVRQKTEALPFAVSQTRNGKKNIEVLPDDDLTVVSGDYVLLIMNKTVEDNVRDLFEVQQGLLETEEE